MYSNKIPLNAKQTKKIKAIVGLKGADNTLLWQNLLIFY